MALSRWVIGIALFAMPGLVQAEELTGTLKKIKDTGTITIGYRETSIPFSYLGAENKPVGFAMDICEKVVDAVKKELKDDSIKTNYVAVTSSTRIPLIANGTVDLVCGSATNNAERQKQVSYTNSHYLSESKYVTKKASKINSIADLKGKTVVSTAGTTNIRQLNERNQADNLGLTILTAKDHAEGFLMVETDRAVAFVMDDILLAGLAANSKDPSLYVVSTDSFSKAEPYGIMMQKGDEPFKKVVDSATAEIYKTEGKALYTKWFQSPIPPKNINLNLQLSPALAKQFEAPLDAADPDAYNR
ncbi:amino acid ABC transporter substrate-binding protein [Rhodomicrobium sp. Az07]|uniref:amino acid ABC transporter substrate-binding protein n=1 Tax=Rhodomicrobium sp. Az07 TaxID=2839034 RepID=UPI001BE84BCD|nr:amino acid ABC transporter substrate-binding protein [Rhodomicrobium sp. Az07]MBT3071631.1 amino acid ABC transporter substrate-binding protein [Rhodomicrobium sp. Az07]